MSGPDSGRHIYLTYIGSRFGLGAMPDPSHINKRSLSLLMQEILSEQSVVSWAHDEIAGSDLGDEKVLVDFRQGRYFGLNPTGRFLFSLLEEPTAVHVLVEALAERHQISRKTASRDVLAFLDSMSGHGLITVEGSS
jgi:hypothetical protein